VDHDPAGEPDRLNLIDGPPQAPLMGLLVVEYEKNVASFIEKGLAEEGYVDLAAGGSCIMRAALEERMTP
jgi:hypothetical protein